ncbi:MAG: GH3 auxin-responsive promoter family protein, partial [Muribaculaceae bacterium]|nr:GH3 auxin-responsive promoter family protein [Muribaculaceae bacterium]
TIHDVWPRLEVFFHGGIAFGPYREQYRCITDPSRMRYLETYNASEGFFAVQDSLDTDGMLLLLDCGIFYEFIPVDFDGNADAPPLPVWEVEQGKVYELIISSCNGLWRYRIGDTVKIQSTAPLRITIAGRTKSFINAFGEELMVHNAEAAMTEACRKTGASVLNYTAAPVYAGSGTRGHHEWLIEWSEEPSSDEEFAEILDLELQKQNSDYQAKRSGSIFLDRLSIVKARRGLFDDWLASTGKLGGQRKVPRLSNSRDIIESLLHLQ